MKKLFCVCGAAALGALILVASVRVSGQGAVKTSRPNVTSATEQISRTTFFGHRLVQVGSQPASEAESQLLLEALSVAAASNYKTGLAELEEYLSIRTNSPWSPSLDAVLGNHYFNIGRYTLALEHWELAWQATKNYPSGNGKKVADHALARWASLLASLGRIETLDVLARENRGRVLDRGPMSQLWVRTLESIGAMHRHPEVSYKCGSFALKQVATELGLKYDVSKLLNEPSPKIGFSVKALTDLSEQMGLRLIPVVRAEGEEIPVPAVVHWRQNHYAAIVSKKGDFYKVIDPTFGHPRYMDAETINAEASGCFLILANQFKENHRALSAAEATHISGRGYPNWLMDNNDGCGSGSGSGGGGSGGGGSGAGGGGFWGGSGGAGGACKPCGGGGHGGGGSTGGSGQSCDSCEAGMPVWEVSEPYINLWLYDTPLAYQPALGPRFALKLNYCLRLSPSRRFGQFGNWGWAGVSYVYDAREADDGIGWASVMGGSGSNQRFDFTESLIASNYHSTVKLSRLVDGLDQITGYELLYPDGAKDVFGWQDPNSEGGVYLLTEKISAEGYVTAFQYEDYDLGSRLKYVVDADGQTNTFFYDAPEGADLISQVQDPYDRSVFLDYDEWGLLTNITDVVGISSSFAYNEIGWLTNLTTPYGPTSFTPKNKSWEPPYDQYDIDRSLEVQEANGSKQLYAYVEYPPYEPTAYSASEVPTNTPIDTLDNAPNYCNSYHWGRKQCTLLTSMNIDSFTAGDYLLANMRHWLGSARHGQNVDTLSLEREPSPGGGIEGQKTWYDYPGKSGYDADKGSHVSPGVIARVLPDGSTWYQWMRRNEWQTPTNVVETYTKLDGSIGLRTNTYTYAANGFDLVLHTGVEGEQVVSNYFGNVYHQVDASYDALNQETRFTYNANRQLTSVVQPSGLTTTNIYYGAGAAANRLEKTIDLEIARTNSFVYAGDLVFSHTDARGLTVTNYWDALQRLTGRKYPDGTTISNIYTTLDLTASKDRLGSWSYAYYNSIRQKTMEINANGVVTGYGLCDCGSILSVTNAWNTPAQLVTNFGYDNQGNRLYTYHPDATETNWFDALGRVIVTGDGWGYRWFYYNNQGLLTVVSNAYGAEKMTVYDIDDHPLYVTDANGVTVTNTYDVLHRLNTRTYPDGGVERFGYSERGLVAYTNQLNFVTYYGYDEARRKLCETNANNEVIRYTNNAAGDLLALVDGKNQVTQWKYDEYGRATNKLDQLGAEIFRYQYDPNSRLTNRWTAAKGDTKYQYDLLGNLTNVDYAVSTDVQFRYDAMNRLTNMVDAVGTTKYTYAAAGQLLTEDGPWSNDTITNTYSHRLRVNLDLQQSSGLWTNAFTYDAAKRLYSVTSPSGQFVYQYPNGFATLLVQKLTLPNSSYITNAYDGNARLRGTWLKNSGHTLLGHAVYGYNVGNQRVAITNGSAIGLWTLCNYDPIGQLTLADSYTASEDRGYAYDAAWNLNYRTNNGTLQTFKVDGLNQLTNAVGSVGKYDPSGNLTNYAGITYTYDDEGRLAMVSDEGGHAYRWSFQYDGLGRLRIQQPWQWISGFSVWSPTYEQRSIYDGKREIQMRYGDTLITSYTRGSDLSGTLEGAGGIGGLLASAYGNNSTHYFFHADGNGNVLRLITSAATPATAALYKYDAYGNVLSSSGSQAGANLYRFSSKQINPTIGLYYYGYRWYAPNLQRWVTRDPVDERGFQVFHMDRYAGSVLSGLNLEDSNLFTFVINNPISLVDSFGLFYVSPTYPTNPLDAPPGPVSCPFKIRTEVWQSHCNGNQPDGDGSCHEAHCIANCRIKRECHLGRISAAAGSWYKEIKDGVIKIISGSGDGFSDGDMKANRKGRRVATECPEQTCEEACAGTRF